MKFENFLLESFGLIYPAAMVYAISLHYPLAPLFPGLTEQENLIRTCLIASGVFLVGRIYYGLSFFLTSKIPHKFTERILNYILVIAIFIAPFFLPIVQEVLKKLYEEHAKDLVNALYDSSKEDIEKSYQFGLRILGLVFGWFVLLFAGELVLRVVIIILHYIFSSLWSAIFPAKRMVKIVRKKTVAVAVAGEEDEQEDDEITEESSGKGKMMCENGVCELK